MIVNIYPLVLKLCTTGTFNTQEPVSLTICRNLYIYIYLISLLESNFKAFFVEVSSMIRDHYLTIFKIICLSFMLRMRHYTTASSDILGNYGYHECMKSSAFELTKYIFPTEVCQNPLVAYPAGMFNWFRWPLLLRLINLSPRMVQ